MRKTFYDFVTEGLEEESFYVTKLVRKKYQTKEERKLFPFNNACLSTFLIKGNDYTQFDRQVDSVEKLKYFTDKLGQPLQSKVQTMYMGLNPIDLHEAENNFLIRFIKRITKDVDRSKSIPSLYFSEVRKAKKFTNILDIDVDLKNQLGIYDLNIRQAVKEFLVEISTVIPFKDILFVETQGGFHLLIKKQNFNSEWNQKTILNLLHTKLDDFSKDISKSSTGMCPIPNTLQNDLMVYCASTDCIFELLMNNLTNWDIKR